MRINYPPRIRESDTELAVVEQQLRESRVLVRVRMLRLLKRGEAASLRECASTLGYSQRQLMRWWEMYDQGGLNMLLKERPRPGKPSRLTGDVIRDLQLQVQAGNIQRLEDARQYLRDVWGIDYQSLNGVWWMFQRHQISLRPARQYTTQPTQLVE
jgi:transposase